MPISNDDSRISDYYCYCHRRHQHHYCRPQQYYSSSSHLRRQQQRRGYRGEAGEAVPPQLSPEELRLLEIAAPKARAIYQKHVELPTTAATKNRATSGDDDDAIRRKRLIYRSKQRGWLEVDLLLGTWASLYVPILNRQELDQFEDFVNMETIDIYNVITLRVDWKDVVVVQAGGTNDDTTDDSNNNNYVVQRIQEWARSSPLGKADPATYSKAKRDANLI